MARLRFPGRPGHRFDRLSLRYFADDIKNAQDPSLAFLPQFQRGIKSFRDIVGVSDEEDEFEGFTAKELKDGERKLNLFNKEQQKKKEGETKLSEMEEQAEGYGKRLGKLRVSLKSLPAPVRPGVKMKYLGRSNKSFLEDKEMTVGKEKIPSVKLKGSKIFDHRKKPKKFKLDYKHGLHDTKTVEDKSKKSDIDMAKFLLEKAKQANKLQEQAKARRLAASKKAVQIQRREFILPTQSSRSSRVIKPNKRFLESDIVNTIVIKKSKADEFAGTTPEKVHGSSFKIEGKKSLESFHPSFSGSPNNKGLLDQPLIVDGKRDRKPSLKLQMSDDELPLFSPTKSAMTSPLAAPKLGTSLFSQSQFQKASEKQKFSMLGFGASRLHGTSIVQKAKLQLNRAALNKSKAALARSLKAEMSREAKYAERAKQYKVDTISATIPNEPVKDKGKRGRKRKCCAVCGKKNDLQICYDKIMACSSCKRFYKECKWLINVGTFTKPKCFQNEKCKLMPDRMKCRYCRIKKVLQVGFPPLPQLTELFEEAESKEVKKAVTVEEPVHVGKAVTIEVNIDVESCSPATKKVVRKGSGTPVHSPVPVIDTSSFLTSPPQPPSTSNNTPTKEQELSPLKAGEGSEKRQRKKRAFKELLRNKQEKVEEELAEELVQQEKPVIAEPIPLVATGSVEISPRGGPGPRIKHVCRNAAVVLGQPLATFPEKSELRLSALPTKDKVQLWKKDEESKAANEDSDDERPMEEIIQQSGDSVVIMKKSPARSKMSKKLTGAGGLHLYKRKMRCRKCPGCIRLDCGTCRHCLDMKKYGGPGTIKKACVERRCSNPLIQRSATEAFIVEKKKDVNEPRAEQIKIVPESNTLEGQSDFIPSDNLESVIPGSEVTQTVFGLETQTGTLLEDETHSNNNVSEKPNENIPSERDTKPLPMQTGSQTFNVERQRTSTRSQSTTTRSQSSEVRKLTFEDIPNFQLERISSRNKESGKISSKLMKKLETQQKYSKKEGGNDGQCYPVHLQSVLPASRQWGSLLSQPKYYPIKVDFKGKCDLGSAWNYGMALTMSNAMSVRALCFLCGSAGKYEMIYCNICCEPFHEFCLEDWEQPAPDHFDDWICAACQFCHVCGRQNNLLQCDKCQNTYHPGCLGPNYPTKPSKRKNIWICTKCVKCKSCGATTPGSDSQATWTYDFSLCYECGQLMDKGNFCPICRKCYSDDDWESKMIQCNMCESWVHSKCEGLTDEMYEILSYLPEDLSFYCRKCFPVGCPEWESTLKRELRQGLENILQSLILSKSSQYILKQEKKSPPKKQVLPSHQTPEKQNKSCTLKSTVDTEATQKRVERNFKRFEKIKELLNVGNNKELTNGIDGELSDSNVELPNDDFCEINHKTDSKSEQTCVNELNALNDTKSSENLVAMETDDCCGDKLMSQTLDIVGDKAGLAEHVISTMNEKTKQSCDIDNPSEGYTSSESCPVTEGCPSSKEHTTNDVVSGYGVNDKLKLGQNEGGEGDKPMICDKQTVCDDNKVNGCESTQTGKMDSNNVTNQCDNTVNVSAVATKGSVSSKNEINKAGEMMDDVRNERTEGCQSVVIHSAGTGKHSNVIHQNITADQNLQAERGQRLNGVDNELSSLDTLPDEHKREVVQRKNSRVHFSVEESWHRQSSGQIQEKENNFPKDLMEIAQKMKSGEYKSVAVFCEDILRVIQTYLDNDEEARTSRKKATQSAKSMFAKQLEKVFPWFNVKTCRHWYSMQSLPDGMLPDATLPPNMDHTYAQWLERIEVPRSPQPSPFKRRTATPVKNYMPIDEEDYEPGQMFEGDDERKCMFCQTFGDQEANDAGRLLYCGQDDWCHINCALWSAEVYEDADGELQNIVEAFSRGKMLRCDMCGKAGATVGCNTKGCKSNYHFMCARRDQCRFQEDKKVFCKYHRMYIDAELLTADRFHVLRRAHVGTLFVRSIKKRWSKGLHCGDISVLMGSCCIENLGRLTDLSDKPKFLQPVDFLTTRMYWSTKDARRRCVYTCRIVEVRPEALKSPTITIKDMRIVHDQDHPDFVPFSNLDLTGINSISEQESLSVLGTDSENPFVDLTLNTADVTAESADMTSYTSQTVDLSETLSAEDHTMEISDNKLELSSNQKSDNNCFKKIDEKSNRRASFSGRPSDKTVSKESDKLSMSWPIGSAKSSNESFKCANLSFLSPQTLKMLNIKDPSKLIKPLQSDENVEEDQEEFSLLKVANRLNRAAAKSSRRSSEGRRSEGSSPLPLRANSRSPSVERGCSPMLTRPFSPIVGVRQRSQSVDRNTEIKPSINQHTKFSSLLASLPEKPFTPPSRMLSRSKSLSLEKEALLCKSSSINSTYSSNEPFLPAGNVESPHSSRRGKSVSDPVDYMPEPVSFSSPVVQKNDVGRKKFNLSDLSTDIEESKSLNTSLFSNSTSVDTVRSVTGTTNKEDGEQTENAETENETSAMITESDVIDTSQNIDTGEETTETIVVMTEGGESLSEEDAIKIVQDIIEQSSSFQTEDQDFCVDNKGDNSTAIDNTNENNMEGDDCTETYCYDSINENEENSDSPFIPQVEDECIVNERLRRNTGVKSTDSAENESVDIDLPCDDRAHLPFVVDKMESDINEGKQKDFGNSEEVKIVVLDTSSDSDNDITDITDSVVNVDHARMQNESKVGDISTKIKSKDKCESMEKENTMKRIVYDLDESIDSDIELLDDLNTTVKDENDSHVIGKNVNNCDNENSVEDVIRLKNSDLLSAECSDTVTQSDNSNEEHLVDTIEIENKICGKDDEIDGDTIRSTPKRVEDKKQQVITSLAVDAEKEDDNLLKSSSLKTVGCVSQSCMKDKVMIQESLQQSVETNNIEDKQLIGTENIDENLDSSKEEIMRGLGLGTFDEVEKLKNSPQKSPSLPELTFERKKKCSKKVPVKSYPLRKNMTSTTRIKEQINAKIEFGGTSKDEVDGSRDTGQRSKTDGKEIVEIHQNVRKELSPELPVLDPIAKKIKEESIAKSCPEDKGPFKCSKCRRQYRTETSYIVHIKNCNFLVSSSEEEDINQDDEDINVKYEGKRNSRSRLKSLNEEKNHKKESICSSDDNAEDKRTTLRRSTQFQRVAIEVAEKRQQEEENPKRGRGRPPFKPKESSESDKEKLQRELMSKEIFSSIKDEPFVAENSDIPAKKGRGRPRKCEIIVRNIDGDVEDLVFEDDKVSQRETRRKSRETKIVENMSQSSDSELDAKLDQETNLVKRKRGRPKKIEINPDAAKHNCFDEKPQAKCLKNMSQSSDSEQDTKQDQDVNLAKRKRGRPKKIEINPEAVKHNSSDEKPEPAKRKLINDRDKYSANDDEHVSTVKCADFQKVKDHLKSQIETIRKNRYRPAKMVHMKTKNKTIRIYVKDRKKMRDRNNKFGLKSVSVRLHKTDSLNKNKESDKVEKKNGCNDKTMDDNNERVKSTSDKVESKDGDEPPLQKNVTSNESNTHEHSNMACDNNLDLKENLTKTSEVVSENETQEVLNQTEKSSDEEGDILDESTGWIVDKKTGEMIRSPTQNNQDDDQSANNTLNDLSMHDENEDSMNNSIEEKDENQESKDIFRFNSPEAKEKKFDEIDNCMEMEDEKAEQSTEISNNEMLENKVESERSDNNEVKAVNANGAIKSMELRDSSNNLPNTVLKLLKDGHKVVIKNPKLNKCFMWQKTADGYIGKPFNKDLAKKPSVSEKTDKSISEHVHSSMNNAASDSVSKSIKDSSMKIQSASDILQERKKLEAAQMQTKPVMESTTEGKYKEKSTENQDIIKRKAKFVAENIERLIETNLLAKARSAVPERLPKGSAEYVGGILISPPKSASADEVKQTIQKTAPIATNMLQNKLIQNKVFNNYQTSVQHVQGNFLNSAIQPAVQSPVPVVSHTLLQQQLQAGSVGMFVQTDFQTASQTSLQTFQQVSPQQSITPAGYSNMTNMQSLSPINQQYTAHLVPSPVIQQTYQPVQVQQVQQIPSLDVGMINVPLMTSVGFSNAQLVQALGTINQNSSPQYLSANTPLVNTQSSAPLLVNPQMSQSLLNTHSAQTLLNQYINQPMLSPQPAQPLMNQFASHAHSLVNQLSTQSQAAQVNQLGSQILSTQSLVNQSSSLVTVSQTSGSLHSMTKSSFAQPRVIYNKTQIVDKLSGNKGPNQKSATNVNCTGQNPIIKTNTYSVLKQKLASQNELEKSETNIPKTVQFFNTHPGLGGGTSSLIDKMHSYLALKHKLPVDSNSSPKTKKMKQIPVVKVLDGNSVSQMSLDEKSAGSMKKQKVKKRLKVKAKLKKELSPEKWRRPRLRKNPTPNISSGIAVPHKPDKASHPMIHGPKEVTSLPVAAAEEEVRDVPLTAFDDNEGKQPGLDGMSQILGHLEYEITSDDGFYCRSDSLDGAWKQVTEKVQDARTASRLKHLSYAGLTGVQMFGLSHPSVVYLVEQLYGASYCRRYKFKYHRHEMVERELELVNPTGCIRTEPFSGRNPTDMFSFLMSRYRTLPENCGRDINEEIAMKSSRRATSMDLPMAMRFRKLKDFSKECVGVYRSTIHGRGLFCKRNIDAGEMIIEYAGEVIRNSMTDIREKYYESKGIGCYMFRIDDLDVVDATMKGSAARFINHSCDPNCYSKVITVDNRKHIVIFAMRKIFRGEELTYDYKFPIEEVKIPCTCGAKKCRRYLN